jgi:hypothetical protein
MEIHLFVHRLLKQRNMLHFANFEGMQNWLGEDFVECRHRNNLRKRKKYYKRNLSKRTKNKHRIYYIQDKTFYLLGIYAVRYIPCKELDMMCR